MTRLADGVPVGIASVDTEGRQNYVNEAFARMVGWDREALIGASPPFAYWPEDELATIRDAFERTLRHAVPPEGFTLVFRRRDGSRLHVLVHIGPYGHDASAPEGWVAAITDISARVALQEELVANEARLREAYAAEQAARQRAEETARRLEALQRATSELTATLTPQEVADAVMRAAIPAVGGARGGVALLSADGSALEVIGMLGYSDETRQRYRRVPMDFSFPLTDAVREGRPLWLANMTERTARYPHLRELLQENGAGAMASLPLIVDGHVRGALGINWREDHDFPAEETSFLEALAHQCAQALERARLYELEQRTRREAEEANRAKSDFLAAMSHELRTPLNGIAGYVDLLDMGLRGPLTPEQHADLERIRVNARLLARLIDDVLSFARIEAGRLRIECAPVAMDETLRAVHPIVLGHIEAKGVRFIHEPCAPDIIALGDHERIVQILVNLLTNAAKATAAGGEVRLDCRAESDVVLVRVADTGTGIPADKLETIFSPFTQLGRSLKAPQAGAGLGLSISRGLAEAMGGSLTVRSEVGAGSTFTLALPGAQERSVRRRAVE